MKSIPDKIKNISKYFWVFLAIFLVGVFLRTYKFHDWMRFSMDQARDAAIISNAVAGKAPLPSLGPDAGNTKFLLGPMYYDLSYLSAKIFGNYPDKMAYPSLASGILAILFLFFFLREYFDQKISLALTGIMSVSYFMIDTSRFSSNPNLVPLFVILFLWGLLKIINDPREFHPGWSALVGFALGMGVQMHAITLVVMPVFGLLALVYFWKVGGKGMGKSLIIIIALALLFNIGQITSELHTNFQNTRNFFQGLKSKSENNYGEGAGLIAACQIEANGYFLTSIGDDYDCGDIFKTPKGGWIADKSYLLTLAAYTLFSLTGYYFLIYNFVREKENGRKNFLGLVLLFNLLTFIVLVSVSSVIHVGYYIVLFFMPFVLLGILMEAVRNKYGRKGMLAAAVVILLLIGSSLAVDGAMASSYAQGLQNNSSNSTLFQAEAMADYILTTSPQNVSKVYFAGQGSLAKRYYDATIYLVRQSGLNMSLIKDVDSRRIAPGVPIYYIAQSGAYPVPGMIGNRQITASRQFLNQTIYILKN
ncbi:MAG: glycosyltransferase family 39 protein [Candidatus Pacebacteria bacterium]|nr:glycosyltransferase family 39 protein [Candidatus Paceibacterota bacterium]MDR3583430.1 glycosyltransferase family 39 protein [Candidatus Paceibacterota bacterium]